MTTGSLTTRVLVKVSGTAPESAVPESSWTLIVDGIYAVELPITALEDLATHPRVQYVEAARPLAPQLVTSLPQTRADRLHSPVRPRPALTGKGVVIGIVDYGMDFTLEDFLNPDGTTRVAFIWDQLLQPQGSEQSPHGFGFGVEYHADAINTALKADDPFAVVRHKPEAGAHGTHVAGIAAGNGRSGDETFPAGRYVGAAPEATIIFVQPDTRDSTGSFTDSWNVALAISYVFAKADELGLPCVVNMSLSQNGGSHDGASLVEQAIDRLLEKKQGRAFVHAAGNGHTWRNHASGTLAQGAVRTLWWKAGGGLPRPEGLGVPAGPDPTPNEVEIWYSPRDKFHVRMISPTGEATPVVAPGPRTRHEFPDGTIAVIGSERFSARSGDANIYILVERGTAPAVTSGVWQVEITACQVREGRFDAWIERDDRERNVAFRQSFFAGTDFDPVMTLGTPATTRRGISVANYNHNTMEPHPTSSRGRTRDGRCCKVRQTRDQAPFAGQPVALILMEGPTWFLIHFE